MKTWVLVVVVIGFLSGCANNQQTGAVLSALGGGMKGAASNNMRQQQAQVQPYAMTLPQQASSQPVYQFDQSSQTWVVERQDNYLSGSGSGTKMTSQGTKYRVTKSY